MLSKCYLILKHATQGKPENDPRVHNYTAKEQTAATPGENGITTKFEYTTFQYRNVKEEVAQYRHVVNLHSG
jgi:hypothetical protein